MPHSEAQPPHLLVIDDEPDQLRLLVTVLRNAPYRVSVALTGDQGYARAAVLLPDLILLDMRMPGRNGITVARLLKTNPATQHIPILFISALTNQQEKLAGLRAGAVDYIGKPFDVDEILERVRIHLELSKRESPTDFVGGIEKSDSDGAVRSQLPTNIALIQVAKKFIMDRLDDSSLKSSDVAASVGLSKRRLNTVFETYDGVSVFEFIRQERMRRAALMLGQSALAIADVAMEVGYENPANFATEFRKFWGKSPTKLRSDMQADSDALQRLISKKAQ